MPSIPGVCGLQHVSVQTGECHYLGPNGESRVYNTTPAIASKLQAWLTGTDQRPLQAVVPELSADERELMLSGNNVSEWDKLFGGNNG